MNHRVLGFVVATVLGCIPGTPAEAEEPAVLENDCEMIGADITNSMKVDLIDPAAPQATRQKALDAYLALVDNVQCPEYGYSIGLLYRFGDELPGNLLPKDVQKARELLLRYAEDGNLVAYADLAEMALKDGNAREAMRWTQVYLYFVGTTDKQFKEGDAFHRSGYNGDLLKRANEAWVRQRPSLSRDSIRADLTSYLQSHKEQTLRRSADQGEQKKRIPEDALLSVKPGHGTCDVDLGRVGGAYVKYVIEVQPDGRPSRIVIQDFAPRIEAAKKLMQCLKAYEFESFPGTEARVGVMPVVYGFEYGPRIK